MGDRYTAHVLIPNDAGTIWHRWGTITVEKAETIELLTPDQAIVLVDDDTSVLPAMSVGELLASKDEREDAELLLSTLESMTGKQYGQLSIAKSKREEAWFQRA